MIGARVRFGALVGIGALVASSLSLVAATAAPAGTAGVSSVGEPTRIVAVGEMEDLGALAGGAGAALAVNDHGVVVGRSWDGVWRPFRYDPQSGTMSDVGPAPATEASWANDINNHGLIVGNRQVGGGFLHDLGTGESTALPLSSARGIADSGIVAGSIDVSVPFFGEVGHPAGFDVTDSSQAILRNDMGDATDVNDAGTFTADVFVEGDCPGFCTHSRPYRITGGLENPSASRIPFTLITTNPFLPPQPWATDGSADAVNAAGDIVGRNWAFTGQGTLTVAYVLEAGTSTPTALGANTRAHDINDSGLIVGSRRDGGGNERAVVWDPETRQPTDLGTLGGDESVALGVNNAGLVVGWSTDEHGQRRPFQVQVEVTTLPQLSGTVTGPGGVPVEGVWIMGYGPDDTWLGSWWASTDSDGFYELELPAPGPVQIMARPPASSVVNWQWYGGGTSRAAATTVDAVYGQHLGSLDIALPATGLVAGTVVDSHGDPVSGSVVSVYGPSSVWVGDASSVAGVDGTFHVGGLADADYRLRVVPPPSSGLPVTWYDGASRRSDASWVSVVAGEPTDVTVSLLPDPS